MANLLLTSYSDDIGQVYTTTVPHSNSITVPPIYYKNLISLQLTVKATCSLTCTLTHSVHSCTIGVIINCTTEAIEIKGTTSPVNIIIVVLVSMDKVNKC